LPRNPLKRTALLQEIPASAGMTAGGNEMTKWVQRKNPANLVILKILIQTNIQKKS